MRHVFHIGFTDTKLFLRDKTAYIWLLLMPLLFIGFTGKLNRGPGGPAVAQPGVFIENRDTGFLGAIMLREIGEQGLYLLGPDQAETAPRRIIIPADFTERILAKEPSSLAFVKTGGGGEEENFLVEARLARAVIAMNGFLIEHAGLPAGEPLSEETLLPILELPDRVTLEAKHAGRKPRPVGFAHSLPAIIVMYLLLNTMIFGGAVVAAQRRNGVLKRMAIHPLTRLELLFGKIFGLLLLAAVQIVFLLAVGQFVLGVEVLDNLFGILLTLFILSWVAASLGVLIGFLIKEEEKVIGLCLATALPAAAIGGCWWPLEIVPPFMQHMALAVPTGWALKALHQLITFGSGMGQIVTPLLVLVAFGLVANLAAARFFRV
jgi:ABC-2 type transport system permease protein